MTPTNEKALTETQWASRKARSAQQHFARWGCEYFVGWQALAHRPRIVNFRTSNWHAGFYPGALGRTVRIPDALLKLDTFTMSGGPDDGKTFRVNPRSGKLENLTDGVSYPYDARAEGTGKRFYYSPS